MGGSKPGMPASKEEEMLKFKKSKIGVDVIVNGKLFGHIGQVDRSGKMKFFFSSLCSDELLSASPEELKAIALKAERLKKRGAP